MTGKLQITSDGPDILWAEKGERRLRYLYGSGQWQELMGLRWTDIEQEEIIHPEEHHELNT